MKSFSGKSLLARLIVVQVACGIAVLFISIVIHVYRATQTENGELDRGMKLFSRAVAAVFDDAGDSERLSEQDMQQVEEIVTEALDIQGRHLTLQVFKMGDGLLYRSLHAPLADLGSGLNGFNTTTVDGVRWRVVATPQPHANVTIVVAEKVAERWLLAMQLAWQVTKPLVWLVPIIFVGGLAASRYAVRPLRQAVASIASRSPEDLNPIRSSVHVSEINPLMGELNRLLRRVAQARKLERDFFADAAHELKTPLAVISTQAYLLVTSNTQAERTSASQDLERSLHRASHMVSQLLALAAVESRTNRSDSEAVELASLLAERLALLGSQADEAKVEMSLSAPPSIAIRASISDLTSIVDNLVDNAIKYNEPGGRVEVTVIRTDIDTIVLSVQNTGAGIPLDQRERVFERFYRGGQVSRSGSGLGLSIVRSAVNRMGGKVYIHESQWPFAKPGSGVAISVHFPAEAS